jgi:hypothetical protein
MSYSLFVGNVLAVRAVGAQDRDLLVGLGSEDVHADQSIRCLELDCDILLVDVREAVRVDGMEVLDFVRHVVSPVIAGSEW